MINERYIFFLGIGGIGMSALARFCAHKGMKVGGYDKTPSSLTRQLEAEGMVIVYEDGIQSVPERFRSPERVIVTPAIPQENNILEYFRSTEIPIAKRAEFLAETASNGKCIAVAGTHGKTTTTSLVAHIVYASEESCNAFVGGIMTEYESNILLSETSDRYVLEADEFDRSFHHLHPEIAVITSMDPDHLDIYGDASEFKNAFKSFAEGIKPEGRLFLHEDVDIECTRKVIRYGGKDADLQADKIRIEEGRFYFDVVYGDIHLKDVHSKLPGVHNVQNALAAIGVALELGMDTETIKERMASYKGVKRRFEYVIEQGEFVFIDDYAHHPSEIKATLAAVRKLYPEKRLTAIFQPHLFTRTRDFMDAFAEELSKVDDLILLDIYPAREQPIAGISSEALLDKTSVTNRVLCTKEELPTHIAGMELEVLLTMGAGDIDREIPALRKALVNRHSLNT